MAKPVMPIVFAVIAVASVGAVIGMVLTADRTETSPSVATPTPSPSFVPRVLFPDPPIPPSDTTPSAPVSDIEKYRIEVWIKANNLNQYGDPQGTGYIGGTPLFDERTGTRIDRYDYIFSRHPDRPWN